MRDAVSLHTFVDLYHDATLLAKKLLDVTFLSSDLVLVYWCRIKQYSLNGNQKPLGMIELESLIHGNCVIVVECGS